MYHHLNTRVFFTFLWIISILIRESQPLNYEECVRMLNTEALEGAFDICKNHYRQSEKIRKLYELIGEAIQSGRNPSEVVCLDSFYFDVSGNCSQGYDKICGSDGVSYESPCHFAAARCKDKFLTLRHVGRCLTDRHFLNCKWFLSGDKGRPEVTTIVTVRSNVTDSYSKNKRRFDSLKKELEKIKFELRIADFKSRLNSSALIAKRLRNIEQTKKDILDKADAVHKRTKILSLRLRRDRLLKKYIITKNILRIESSLICRIEKIKKKIKKIYANVMSSSVSFKDSEFLKAFFNFLDILHWRNEKLASEIPQTETNSKILKALNELQSELPMRLAKLSERISMMDTTTIATDSTTETTMNSSSSEKLSSTTLESSKNKSTTPASTTLSDSTTRETPPKIESTLTITSQPTHAIHPTFGTSTESPLSADDLKESSVNTLDSMERNIQMVHMDNDNLLTNFPEKKESRRKRDTQTPHPSMSSCYYFSAWSDDEKYLIIKLCANMYNNPHCKELVSFVNAERERHNHSISNPSGKKFRDGIIGMTRGGSNVCLPKWNFQGKIFSFCTNYKIGFLWCAVSVDRRGEVLEWDECLEAA